MGSSLTFKDEPEDNGDALMLFEHRCPPGLGVAAHSESNHEAFYVLEGRLDVQAAGELYRLGPGDFLCMRPGVVHLLHNPGPDWMRVLTVVAPGSQHERFFSILGEPIDDTSNAPQPSGPPDIQRVQQVGRECGIVFLPSEEASTMADQALHSDGRASQVQAPPIQQMYAKLPAQDVDRARAFYAEKLRLKPFGEHNRHLHYELNGGYFIIFPSKGRPSGTHDQLGFVVEDIEGMVAQLEASGILFEDHEPIPGARRQKHITDLGGVKAAWFKDSEGNLISMAEFPGGSPFKRSTTASASRLLAVAPVAGKTPYRK